MRGIELRIFEQVVESLLHTHPDLVERNRSLWGFKLSSETYCKIPSWQVIIKASIPPPPPTPHRSKHKNQPQQNRHLDQRSHRRRQRLVALLAKHRHRHRNSQLEIIARRRESLRGRHPVPEPHLPRHEQRREEHDGEVDDQWSRDAQHGDDLVYNAVALRGEENDDGEEEAEEGEWGEVFDEDVVVPFCADELSERDSRHDGRGEGDTEEDGDARGDGGIRQFIHDRRRGTLVMTAADDADKEQRQRRIQHHLQH